MLRLTKTQLYSFVLRLKNCTVGCARFDNAGSSFVTSRDSPDMCVGFSRIDCTAGASAAFGSVCLGCFVARIIKYVSWCFRMWTVLLVHLVV